MSVTVAVAVANDVQSAIHQHARRLADEYVTDSLPHRWCCDASRTTPLSVAPSSGRRHEFLLTGNVGDANFRPSFYKKQYLSNGETSCREISHKHCK